MRRMRRRRSTVRWLPNNSAFALFSQVNLTAPNTISGTNFQQMLILEGGYPVNLAGLSGVSTAGLDRTDTDALIIDHIQGKVGWQIWNNYSSSESVTGAQGKWMYFIRCGIVIRGAAPEVNAVGGPTAAAESAGSTTIVNLDPGAVVPNMLLGSNQPDGVRWLWRRMWMIGVDWALLSPQLNSEYTAPPSGYVDIKPKRLLRPTERLDFAYQVTSVGFATNATPASGVASVVFSHDLRTAGHNTKRRR